MDTTEDFFDEWIGRIETSIKTGAMVQYSCPPFKNLAVFRHNDKWVIESSLYSLVKIEFDTANDAAKTFVEIVSDNEGPKDEEEGSSTPTAG
jgi:hypothetical protein